MSINTAIHNWIDKSAPDYYTMFIKVWIPYNAWYMHNYYEEDNRTSDKAIISHIKEVANPFKDKIIALLRNNDEESNSFKKMISKLHQQLERVPIPNSTERISFSSVNLFPNLDKNGPKTIAKRGFSVTGKKDITLPKTSKRWIFEIVKNANNKTICRIELNKCSVKELYLDYEFSKLDSKYKMAIEECLKAIDPEQKVSVIIPPIHRGNSYVKPPNSICLDKDSNLYFTEDISNISKALISIMYELRCKLFHGEIEPNADNLGVYEWAYKIQYLLNKSLK